MKSGNSATLLRYNFRVMVTNNWWLLVFPIAVSQLTVFWTIITERQSPTIAPQSAEMVSPILAAFLSAHVLSPEYPARIAALLASKPLNIGKIVVMRLSAVMGLVLILLMLSQAAFYFGMGPFPLGPVILAAIPSVLFLSMLALTFATIFRHPLAGFGVAALYWAMDLPPGPPMNPYLSLRSLTSSLATGDPGAVALSHQWWVAKVLLLVGAAVLYAIHARLVFRLAAPLTLRFRLRSVAAAGAIVALYVTVGAAGKVEYGYSHRGALYPNDGAWYRTQFSSFGPIPASYLFGSAFRAYIGHVPSAWRFSAEGDMDLLGDTPQHLASLGELLQHMPNSMWAPAAADLLARLAAGKEQTLGGQAAVYQRVVDRYPSTPYAEYALYEEAQVTDDAGQQERAIALFRDLLKRYPKCPYRSYALHYLVQVSRSNHDLAGAETYAREWIKAAPVHELFGAWLALMQILRDRGDHAGAADAAHHVTDAVAAFRDADARNALQATSALPISSGQVAKWERDAQDADNEAHRQLR